LGIFAEYFLKNKENYKTGKKPGKIPRKIRKIGKKPCFFP
jgi:hypothetical protein